MFAQTVDDPVDRHIAPLVDAINRSREAATYSSCSGHMKDSGFPYVGFKSKGWKFVGKIRKTITQINEVTRGQPLLEIRSFGDDEILDAVIRFRMYPWLWAPRVNLAPLAAQLVFPPPRLVRLWWNEIAELARMIEEDEAPGEFATNFFASQRSSDRGFPWWGEMGVSIGAARHRAKVPPRESAPKRKPAAAAWRSTAHTASDS